MSLADDQVNETEHVEHVEDVEHVERVESVQSQSPGIGLTTKRTTSGKFTNPGTNGANGINGVKYTNGANGVNGISGISGISGINGINGISSVSGVNGVNGVSGVNDVNGANGTNGNIPSVRPVTRYSFEENAESAVSVGHSISLLPPIQEDHASLCKRPSQKMGEEVKKSSGVDHGVTVSKKGVSLELSDIITQL